MLPQNEKKRCSHEYLPFHSSHYAKTKVLFFIDMVRHVTGRTMRMFRFLGKSMVVDIIENICSISAFHHRPVDDVP